MLFLPSRGETIHFTYDVPEGFIVDKEGWSWCFAYTDGRGCTYYDGEYGDSYSESYTYEQREPMSNLMEKVALLFPTMKWFV